MKRLLKMPSPLTALIAYTLFVLAVILSLEYLTLIAAPLFFAFVIAYLFEPAVVFVVKKSHLPRGLTAALFMVLLVFAVVFMITLIFPYVLDQLQNAADRFPQILESFSRKMKIINDYLVRHFSRLLGNINILQKMEEWLGHGVNNFSQILGAAFNSVYNILLTLLYLVFVPLFAFYFIKDARKIKEAIFGLIPPRFQHSAGIRLKKMDGILSSFIRGQAIVVFILAVLYSTGLTLIGLPFSIIIGVFAGFGDIVPYFGTIIGFIVSVIVGLTYFESIEGLLMIMLVFAVVKATENWFIYPKIVGKEVGLHFVWVLLTIFLFGRLFGFWGLIVAIPAAAGFKVFLHDLLVYYKNSQYFNKG